MAQARIEDLVVPTTNEREAIEIEFVYAARSPIVALDVGLATPLGTTRKLLPASFAGVEGKRGAGRFDLDLRAVPPGPSELTLTVVQADGKPSDPVSATFEVPGTGGGAAPRLRKVGALDERVTRPGGDDLVLGSLTVVTAPGDHDLAATWVRLRQPDGHETVAVAPAPPEDKGSVTFAAFGAEHELGEYVVAVTLLDAAGNTSETLEAAVALVADGGAQGPSIDGFKPATASAGDEVVVRGSGLDVEGLTLEVGGIEAAILGADAEGLRILMPAVDTPGRLVAIGPAGTGLSSQDLTPRAQVRVVPEAIELPEGESVALSVVVTGTTDGAVEWSAAARSGEPGSISPEGIYTPPVGGERGKITISAASVGSPDVAGRATVRVVAHPPARGPLRLGPLGGTVRSQDDGSSLTVPRGALTELTSIGVETTAPELEDELGGDVVVAGARIDGPAGPLGVPAELMLPLRFPLQEGERVRVQFREDPGGPWEDLSDLGLVIPGSELLKIVVERANGFYQGKFEYVPATPSYLPSITGIGPSSVDEGATVAVLVTGKNFVPGVTGVAVLKQAGGVEPRVEVRTVYVTGDGTKLGVTLKAGVMTDLAEGSSRSLRLRVTTPAGSAERSFDIIGHDELDVQGTVSLSQSRTFSRVSVAPGATLRIAHASPPITVTAFETFVVGGAPGPATVDVLTGSGAPGTRGDAPAGGGSGGAGGVTAVAGPVGTGGAGGSGGNGASGNGTPGSAGTGPPIRGSGAGGGGGFGGFGFGRDGASGSAAPMPAFPTPGFAPPLVSGGGGGGAGGGGGGHRLQVDSGRWRRGRSGGRGVRAGRGRGAARTRTHRCQRRQWWRRGLPVPRRDSTRSSSVSRRLWRRRRRRRGRWNRPARRAAAER